jgi:flavin reductase (DIM6/NTAB) family NADH-FMN oxidoreductase RutF
MAKTTKDLSGAPFPTPVVLVTTASADGTPNIITLAWAGIVCSGPLMVGLAVRPSRHSHALLAANPELVVNLPGRDQVESTDYCGTVSGRDTDKFAATGWTPVAGEIVNAPLINECPINLECRVSQRLALGTHDLFICEVVRTHVDVEVLDEAGRVDFKRLSPFVYAGMDYWTLAEKIGHYGYSKKQGRG